MLDQAVVHRIEENLQAGTKPCATYLKIYMVAVEPYRGLCCAT